MPTCFLDVLIEWGSTWLWDYLHLVGEDNWLEEVIQDKTFLAVTYGSYIKELYLDLCSAAFVLECEKGRGKKFWILPGTVGCGRRLSSRDIRTHGNSPHPSSSEQS